MAAMPSSARAGKVPCPDPSAHGQAHVLSEQASTAALYVTDPARHTEVRHMDSRKSVLGPDGKLSSSSAAASLKYARPQDLPSYPSSGLSNADSAGKAAMLAKDYKMKDLWQPEMSSAGSKAALIAARDGGKLDLWEPTASKAGNSAAVIAMRTKGLSPELDRGYTADGKQRALTAATLSIKRNRAGSQPVPPSTTYPDQHNATYNALNAATVSHRASVKLAPDGWDSEANQAARIKNIKGHVDPHMFGSAPPVEIELEEKRHDAALRASAVSMAKQMYEYQNRTTLEPAFTGGKAAADAANARSQPTEQVNLKQEALRYIHLQDAAQKLAQERLAEIDRSLDNAKYKEYYGYPDNKPKSRSSMNRLSMRGPNRRRANSEGAAELDSSDDEEQARRIRSQMTQLNTGLSTVDEKKRTDDRAKLLAAAEKKVHAQMHTMDEKVFADTGKVPPAMMEEWEAKARKRAQEDRELQARPENKGKTHIGGGKFMDQSAIEAIAAARLKPTLDEISDTAAKRRARDVEIAVAKDRENTRQMDEKEKTRKEKEVWKQHRDADKAAARKDKDEAKIRKAEEHRKSFEEEPEKKKGGVFSMLRRSRKGQDGKVVESDKPADATADPGTAGTVTAGVVAGEAAEKRNTDPTEEDEAIEEDESDDEPERGRATGAVPIAVPVAQPVSAAPITSSAARPDLERHFTELGHSDDDEDDEDWNDSDEDLRGPTKAGNSQPTNTSTLPSFLSQDRSNAVHGNLGQNEAHIVADRVGTAPVGETIETPSVMNERTDKTLPEKATKGDASGPAPHTLGPHESDIANIVDPRVKPDPEMLGSVKATGAAPSSTVKTGPDEQLQAQQQQKGFRGFFSKLRHRQSKPEGEMTKPQSSSVAKSPERRVLKKGGPSAAVAVDSVSSEQSPSHMDTEGAINDERKVSGLSATSSSSFKRGEAGRRDLDDVSSSGADEEELGRGRSGPGFGTMSDWTKGQSDIGKLDKGTAGAATKVQTNDDDEEQFEEARDHFDEGLAPPPSFAGQKKSESPVRETKFREDV
ncbi:hypothetical protein LTR08_007932 [Meristemomyces frigidus]|nr:hypothetical protein LTR08_007932 [Meristemomyces frigidus]